MVLIDAQGLLVYHPSSLRFFLAVLLYLSGELLTTDLLLTSPVLSDIAL